MAANPKSRITSIDLLKGIVMVVMALDHVRDYFHYSAFMFDPGDISKTTLPIFFTRFITNFCAPAFSFLAGLSAFIIGKRKTASALSAFLLKRGLWLVFVEIIIMSFGWKFDPHFTHIGLQTIWQLGISMIVLAGLVQLSKKAILIFSCIVIFGHNALDNIHFEGNFLWAVIHERQLFEWAAGHYIRTAYPLLPWIAVMPLGYCFGTLYDSAYDATKRKKILNILGCSSLALFALLTYINRYGDPMPWKNYGNFSKNLMSVLNSTKYPPSLQYLLITLGGTFLFLANSEKLKGKMVDFFCVFGRVPFFYYIIHIYLIHLIAAFTAKYTGFGWQALVLPKFITAVQSLKGYGFNLITVYCIWIIIVLLLYPLCKKFDNYKQSHKEKWWLSYL
jgi:uncharacterized membrane protein